MAGSISEFYKGKNVFITGGTGFIGRVLIEKLLRSCPDIGNIYVLIRRRKGVDIWDRVDELVNLPVYEVLRDTFPENLKKIIPIEGDCMSLGLGLSDADYQILEDNVNIVFHVAASVRFDDPLRKATILNVRATREIMLLAKKIKNLEVLIHVSTMYCNCDKKVVEERFYPPPTDWRKFIELVETSDNYTLDILEPKIIGRLPNTYLFTKALAEHVVKDLADNLPILIVRPSIVINTWYDPFPGWIDNWNGPIGITISGAKGVMRTIYIKNGGRTNLDCIPCDYAVRVICAAAWDKARSKERGEPTIYNVTAFKNMYVKVKDLDQIGCAVTEENPLQRTLWVPRWTLTESKIYYIINVLIFQLFPAILLDKLLKWNGHRPILVNIQRKLWLAVNALEHFTNNEWTFKHDRTIWLNKQLGPNDNAFNIEIFKKITSRENFEISINGVRKYLLKETQSIEENRRQLNRLKFLEKVLRTAISIFGIWLLYRYDFFEYIISVKIQ